MKNQSVLFRAAIGFVAFFVVVSGAIASPNAAAKKLTPFVEDVYAYFPAAKKPYKAVRGPQQAGQFSISDLSPELRKMRSDFFGAKNSVELAALVDSVDTNYKNLSASDAQLYGAILAALKPFRGILYRLRPMFEREKITQSVALSAIKNFAASLQFQAKDETNKIVFDYLAAPYKVVNGRVIEQIQDEYEVLEWISGEVKLNELKLLSRINTMKLDNKAVLIDKSLFYGPNSFADGIDRFVQFGEIERQILMAGLESDIAYINYARAYTPENLLTLSKQVGMLYGIDGLFSGVDGVTALDIHQVMSKNKFKETFVLMPDGKSAMRGSYKFLLSAANRLSYIWDEVKKRPASTLFAVNTGFLQIDTSRGDTNMDIFINVVKGQNPDGSTILKSAITGEVATFNLKAFFENPPENLKELLPNGFEMEKEKRSEALKVSYRNYFYGRPTSWDVSKFKSFLPEVKDSQGIISLLRAYGIILLVA